MIATLLLALLNSLPPFLKEVLVPPKSSDHQSTVGLVENQHRIVRREQWGA